MRASMAACTTASDSAGSSSARRPGSKPSSHPAKPPAENHCNWTENKSISKIANQKLGMAIPTCVSAIIPTSPSLLWRAAA